MLASRCFRLFIFAIAGTSTCVAQQTLYVATYQHVYVFTPGADQPRLTIADGLAGVSQIAIDNAGKRYAANFGTPLNFYRDSSVTQYDRGQTMPAITRTDGAVNVTGIAVDAFGDVFASSYYLNTVSVYFPGHTHPLLEWTKGLSGPLELQLHDCNLYVESGLNNIVRLPEVDTLTVTAPGAVPDHALTYGGPFAVADDGTVVSGGYVLADGVGYEEFVDVFSGHATTPTAGVVISTGENAAFEPYVAVSGDSLYVSAPDIDTVFEYSLSGNLKLVRKLTMGLSQPGPLAVDAEGNLYVADATEVLVYAPKSKTPRQTIVIPEESGAVVELLIAK